MPAFRADFTIAALEDLSHGQQVGGAENPRLA